MASFGRPIDHAKLLQIDSPLHAQAFLDREGLSLFEVLQCVKMTAPSLVHCRAIIPIPAPVINPVNGVRGRMRKRAFEGAKCCYLSTQPLLWAL